MKFKNLSLCVLILSVLCQRTLAEVPAGLLAVGTVAPDFTVQTAEGKEVHLSDYKGQVVVLDFWATWCRPCIASFPHTQEVAGKYQDQGVVVLALGTSDTNVHFKEWIPRNQATYPGLRFVFDHLHERGSVDFKQRISAGVYGVESIPTQFVIGRDGRILGTVVGQQGDDARTEALLARAGVKVDAALAAKGEYQFTPAGKEAAERVAAEAAARSTPPINLKVGTLKEGAVVPEFDFLDAAGQTVKASALIGNKVAVLLLWTPAAAPAPEMLALCEASYQKCRSQGVVFLGVVYGGTTEEFMHWREQAAGKFSFPVVLDPSGKAPVAPKPADDMSVDEAKAYAATTQAFRAGTFLGHLMGDRLRLMVPGIFVFDPKQGFLGFGGIKGPMFPEALGNLLVRAGVKLTAADMPAKIWTDEELQPRPPPVPAHAVKTGDLAPDFTAQDLAGKPVKLSAYRGKVVVLDFWATWCGPCMASMPHTQEVTARYKDQGVVTLGSCTSDTRVAFEKWVNKNQAQYPDIVWAHDAAERGDERVSSKLYGVTGIPKQFIIDREGKVVDTVTGYLPGEALLDAALAKAGIKVDPALIAKAAEDLKKRG